MLWYLITTSVVVLICFEAYRSAPKKYADLMGVAVMLSLVFGVCNTLYTFYGYPDTLLAYPVFDLALSMMVYRSWRANKEPWKVAMVVMLVFQLMLHAVCIAMWKTGGLTQGGLYTYAVAVNVFFVFQLATLASVGIGHGLDCVRAWVSDRRRLHLVADAKR